MRVGLLVALLASSFLVPLASAHGANDFAIIMRSSSIQPSEAEVMQNDSVTFYNVADENRTILVDLDEDGSYDRQCDTAPYNSSSVKDECSFIIFSDLWSAGNYHLDVFSNGTLWGTLNLTVIHDYHEEDGPPSGYVFNDGASENEEGGDGGLDDSIRGLAISLLACSALVFLARRGE